MRNISFALTTPQFIARTKTVTRRVGWQNLRIGERLCAVEKAQGLKRGEKVKRLGIITVLSVRRERLRAMTDAHGYGVLEVEKEGFTMPPERFVRFFCETHGCTPETTVTRIEFAYA